MQGPRRGLGHSGTSRNLSGPQGLTTGLSLSLSEEKEQAKPQTQIGIRLVWTSPACRPKSNCSRLEASSQAPSEETRGLEPPPNPNWHPSGLSLQTQIQLFKIGSNQLGHRLKKTKGLEPPPNPNRHPSGLDKSSLQTQRKLFEIGSIQPGHRPKKTTGLEPPPNPNWHLWS